jgi:hypothetical protein
MEMTEKQEKLTFNNEDLPSISNNNNLAHFCRTIETLNIFRNTAT